MFGKSLAEDAIIPKGVLKKAPNIMDHAVELRGNRRGGEEEEGV